MPIAEAPAGKGRVTKKRTFVQPTLDFILVVAEKKQEKTPGGIVIPDIVKGDDRVQIGKIIAVGPGIAKDGVFVPMERKIGERVYFAKRGGYTVEFEGKELHMVVEETVIAVIEDEK